MTRMKSQETMDLAELERQLGAVIAARPAQGDDPLLELARMVGQVDQGAGRETAARASFDDYLAAPPRPAGGAMPVSTPPYEPLFPESPVSAEVRGAATGEIAPRLSKDDEAEGEFADPSGISGGERGTTPATPPQASGAVDLELDDFEAELRRDFAPVTVTGPNSADVVENGSAPAQLPFADMMAEFDSAMRDVGARPVAPASANPSDPILDPGVATVAGMAVASAAAGYGASRINPEPVSAQGAPALPAPRRSRRGLMLAAGVVGVSLLGVVGMLSFGGASKPVGSGGAPAVIAAKPGAMKERPVNPGGAEVPDQDREVLQKQAAAAPVPAAAPVRVVPREEQPVDLTQAQRQVTSSLPAETPAIRQIPGISVVAPVTTSPPASQAAPDAPTPRPVASVPITIAGQPPVAPPVSPPAAVAPPAVTAPAPAIAAPPAAGVPATPAAEPRRQASAEPRRVRSVPIRSEGEGQPTNRAAAPRAEPEDPNGPLRITPAANRAPRQQTAAVAPATTATAPAAGGSGFAVQLAAEGSDEAARAKFSRMRSQHGGVLGGLSPSIRSAEVNGRSVYRVRVGNLSREEAVGLCERLKADGGSCFVARN